MCQFRFNAFLCMCFVILNDVTCLTTSLAHPVFNALYGLKHFSLCRVRVHVKLTQGAQTERDDADLRLTFSLRHNNFKIL